MKTSELTGHALSFVVSQLEGADHDTAILNITVGDDNGWKLDYLTWGQAGPIIERECIELSVRGDSIDAMWAATSPDWYAPSYGPTPLIAAMRCFVASKLGDDIEVPKELT